MRSRIIAGALLFAVAATSGCTASEDSSSDVYLYEAGSLVELDSASAAVTWVGHLGRLHRGV